jgi:hypothetical protein
MLGEVGVRSMDIRRPMSIDIGRASDASSACALTDICCCAAAPTCARMRDARAYTLFRQHLALLDGRISREHASMHQKGSDTGISTVMPWREEEDRLPPELGPCPTVVLESGGEGKSWPLKSQTLTASVPKKKYVCVLAYVRQGEHESRRAERIETWRSGRIRCVMATGSLQVLLLLKLATKQDTQRWAGGAYLPLV